ncbi:MAG: hypothetical protein ACYTF6_12915, partial [Planctomycetota bacterium]
MSWKQHMCTAKSSRLTGLSSALLPALIAIFTAPAALAEKPRVSVFNFQMKSPTPEWRWLEKGLADRVITDLFQERTISVVQRDTMQRVAEQMNWTPEMILDARRLEQIRKALKPKYLISGVYEVKAGKLTITAIIVDFEAKKEVARREVSGPAGDALKLTRKLSASLISWLTK